MKRRVLVTGIGGYIGSITAYTLLIKGFEVIGIDNFSVGFRQPLELLTKRFSEKRFRYYEADLLNDISTILEKERGIDVVLHLAGKCSVDESIRHPEEYFTNNVVASQNLLQTMLRYNISRIVFSSTCAVYGETNEIVNEKKVRVPTNPYGESKKITEDMLFWYGKLYDFNYVILRYFNVCGATQNGLLGDSKKPSPHLVQNTVRAALGIDKLLLTSPKVNTPDGTTIRDYVDVVDLSIAHINAIQYLLKGGKNEAINISGGKGSSVLEIVKKVEKITGAKIPLAKGPKRLGEYSKMTSSYRKAKRILNWEPQRSIDDSIQSLVKWYRKKPNGWES
jgi:UDP-glucose 4-epimerase